ncbi:MAG: hypothetical protein ABSA17_01870 [Rhabdochlamydiaceae bacterium]|jgi:hypothetical protein
MGIASVAACFSKDEPKQFFSGAELCARLYALYKGGCVPNSVDKVLNYTQIVQEALSFPLALGALKDLHEKWSFDVETVKNFADVVSNAAEAVDFAINKIFEFKRPPIPYLKPIGFAAGFLYDICDLKSAYNTRQKFTKISASMPYISAFKSVMSIFLCMVSLSIYLEVKNKNLHKVSLVLETTVFMSMVVLNYLEDTKRSGKLT